MEATIEKLLTVAKERKASDLHITVGVRPKCRVCGELIEMEEFEQLTPDMTKNMLEQILLEHQRSILYEKGEVDFAYSIKSLGRFRVNVFKQRGSYAAVLRLVSLFGHCNVQKKSGGWCW